MLLRQCLRILLLGRYHADLCFLVFRLHITSKKQWNKWKTKKTKRIQIAWLHRRQAPMHPSLPLLPPPPSSPSCILALLAGAVWIASPSPSEKTHWRKRERKNRAGWADYLHSSGVLSYLGSWVCLLAFFLYLLRCDCDCDQRFMRVISIAVLEFWGFSDLYN